MSSSCPISTTSPFSFFSKLITKKRWHLSHIWMVERVRLCACFSSTDSNARHNPCHEPISSCRYSGTASDAPHTWWWRVYSRHRLTCRYIFAARDFNLDRAFLYERLFRCLEDSDDIGSEYSVRPVGIGFSGRVVLDAPGEVENLFSQSIVRDDHNAFHSSLPV